MDAASTVSDRAAISAKMTIIRYEDRICTRIGRWPKGVGRRQKHPAMRGHAFNLVVVDQLRDRDALGAPWPRAAGDKGLPSTALIRVAAGSQSRVTLKECNGESPDCYNLQLVVSPFNKYEGRRQ